MVLEANNGVGGQLDGRAKLEHHIADEAGRTRLGVEIEQAQPRQGLAADRHVVAAQELVAAAHREYDRTTRHGAAQRLPLLLGQVAGDQVLVLVLAAADEEEVDVGRASAATLDADNLNLHLAQTGALNQGRDVAAVAVDAHLAGVEVADAKPRRRHQASQ